MGEDSLVGRNDELATLLDTVAGAGARYAVLVSGPGMGKTSVLLALQARAAPLSLTVWRAAPSELDESLGYSALADLLAEVDDEAYDRLPAPLRSAARAALLLEEAGSEIDPRAVAVAFRTLLRSHAEQRPVVIVIDDAHWLDAATAQVLGHALRRTRDLPVRVVAAARPSGRSVDEWLPARPEDRRDLVLGPMTPEELGVVVRRSVGTAVERSSLPTLAEVCEGNPLFAIEVARRRGHVAGQSRGLFDELLAQRLGDLPRATRLTLLTGALAGSPTLEVVAGARSRTAEAVVDDLAPAVAGGLVSVVDRIRFAHPLYATAVVAVAEEDDVRATHARLIEVDRGDEVRARHRALAADGPDAALAGHLDNVARAARGRGARHTAIDLLLLAVSRSPEGDERAERALMLGTWLARAGRPDEARPWLHEAHTAPGTAHRAGLELLRTAVLGGSREEVDGLVGELTNPEVPLLVRAEAVMIDLDWDRDVTEATAAARMRPINAQLAELGPDPEALRVLGRGLLMEAWGVVDGTPAWRDLIERARAIEAVVSPALAIDRVDFAVAGAAICADRHDEARALLRSLITISEETGDDLSLPTLLLQQSWLEARVGHWDLSDDLAREGVAAASSQHQHWEQQARVGLAETRGMRGDTDEALAELDRLYEGVAHPLSPYPIASWWAAKAQVLLAGGRTEEAYDAFTRVLAEAAGTGAEEPGVLQADAAFLDCLVALGRLDEAAAHLGDVVERVHRRYDNPSVLVECGRISVLLTAARGDLDDAVRMIPEMLAAHADGVGPLQRGHAYLTAGRIYRRAKAKTRADEALGQAVRTYDELGAGSYAEQARAEQARVGLRPRASDDLTDTERQVADLAVSGLRNREIADRLFLSVKTVEAVLGRVYRKLGIRSRSQLAGTLSEVAPDS